jgi:hypothetical protein
MKPSKPRKKGRPRKPRPRRRPAAIELRQDIEPPADPLGRQPGTGPRLSAGDVDADWARAESSGEETVGGSVATPDQDVVDEIGRALGVEQNDEAELTTSEEMLHRRDRLRWHIEQDAEAREHQEEERRDSEEQQREGHH